jgi:nucleotide-binding universal stress UspA family protein
MNQLKTILVGVDFSECSRRALEQAVRLARWNNANLRIIHVLDPATLDVGGVDLPPEVDTVRRLHREQTIAWLAEWAEAAGAPPGHSREVMNGVPLDILLQESRSRGANLLVLGVTGESLLPHGTGTLAT